MNKKMAKATTQNIKVPSLGESITEATIARWLKKKGDPVNLDEPLVEVETDKVTLEISSPATGTLAEITAEEGATVEVDSIVGTVLEGEAKPSSKKEPMKAPVKSEEADHPPLSPAVRKLVEEAQVDPNQITGQGKDGRLTKGDVLTFLDQHKVTPSETKTASVEKSVKRQEPDQRVERVRLSKLRQRIAERLKEAQNTAAILTTFNEVDMSQVIRLRSQLKENFEKKHGVKLGFMSFFTKACIVALKEFPAVNAEIDGDELVYKNYYDIGIAVGTPQGLVVPIVRNADQKSFAEIEKDILNLGKKAQEGKLSMSDLQGGTFTISNGGIYGSLMSTPILNPPQSGILGMHKIEQRPMAVDGKVEIRPMMYLALSYDHRIIDGREAVTFLVRVKECLENPERTLLDI